MDKIPYEFITKVFNMLHHETIREEKFNQPHFVSPLWDEVVSTNKKKLKTYYFNLFPTAAGFKTHIFINYSLHELATRTTFDDLLQMDQRYTRIIEFAIRPHAVALDPDNFPTVPVDRFPEILDFVAQFHLDRLTVALTDEEEAYHRLKLIFEEFGKRDLISELLELIQNEQSEQFMKAHLRKEEWRELTLVGDDCDGIKDELFAFVCRPQFKTLETMYGCFGPEDVRKVIDYCNTMENPWKEAKIIMRTNYLNKRDDELACDWMDEYATWMVRSDSYLDYYVYEHHGDKFLTTVAFSDFDYSYVTVRFKMNKALYCFSLEEPHQTRLFL